MAEPPLEGTHGFRRRLKENYLQLMSLKDEEDEWDRLESAVVGASGSVDAVVRARNGRLVPPIEEGLLLLADARLALRCVICLEDVTEQNQNARHSLEQTVSRLGSSGWQVRLSRRPTTFTCLVIDGRATPFRGNQECWVAPEHRELIVQHFQRLWENPAGALYEELILPLGPNEGLGLPSAPGPGGTLVVASERFWSGLIARLSASPELLYSLDPRRFEELIAELLERDGLSVQLTPRTRDGGRDILAFAETAVGEHLYLVECKRRSRNQPVRVELVRALYGVVTAERATAGLLVTTSSFTRGALAFRESVKHQLSLKDYEDLVDWLDKYSPKSQ